MRYCCDDLKYAIAAGDIIHNVEKNEFYAYGRPSFSNDGDGYTDDMTETLKMQYCLFCGKQLVPPSKPPHKDNTGVFTTEHKCSSCGHCFEVNICSKAVNCPECNNWDVENIGVAKT